MARPRHLTSAGIRIGLALIALAAAFALGRLSVASPKPPTSAATYNAGYLAGREAAFAGYDGGWAYGVQYVITLQRGGPGITYRIASRTGPTPEATPDLSGGR